MQEFAKAFYKSQAWKNCRAAYAKSVGSLCELCLAKGIYRPGDIVHHIVHITPENVTDPEVVLNWSNLQLVCRDCHAQLHNGRPKRWTLDEFGRVVF